MAHCANLKNRGKHPEARGARSEITCGHQAEESDAEGGGFRRLMPASDLPTRTTRRAGVFLLYRTYLWNKQQVISINITTWSTMQCHVVMDHVVFYVIHSQVRYNTCYSHIRIIHRIVGYRADEPLHIIMIKSDTHDIHVPILFSLYF